MPATRSPHVSADAPYFTPNVPTQRLTCPHCRNGFSAPRRAITLRCPSCGRGLHLQDAVLSGFMAGNVSTVGLVHVTRRGSLLGRVDCSKLSVEGRIKGSIDVHGTARLAAGASVSGSLSATHVVIEPGATFRGELNVGPQNGQPSART